MSQSEGRHNFNCEVVEAAQSCGPALNDAYVLLREAAPEFFDPLEVRNARWTILCSPITDFYSRATLHEQPSLASGTVSITGIINRFQTQIFLAYRYLQALPHSLAKSTCGRRPTCRTASAIPYVHPPSERT